MDNRTNDDILSELNRDKITEYAAAIGYAAVVMVFGIIGNIASVVFYGYKSTRTTTNRLIMYLAATDMIACFANTDLIIQLCYSINFTNKLGCQIMFFINHCLVFVSTFLLVVICVDRFRKICRPHFWQLTFMKAKLSTVCVIVFSLLATSRDFVFLDIVSFNVTVPETGQQIEARYCTLTKDPELTTALRIVTLVDLLLVFAIVVSLVVLYTIIARKLWKHHKVMKKKVDESQHKRGTDIPAIEMATPSNTSHIVLVNVSPKTNVFKTSSTCTKAEVETADKMALSNEDETSESNEDIRETASTCNSTSQNTTDETIDMQSSSTAAQNLPTMPESRRSLNPGKRKGCKTNERSNARRPSDKRVERNITFMMIAITAASLLSFMPHLIVSYTIGHKTHFPELNVGMQIAFRSYILNNAINPYITLIFNPKFRRFVTSSILDIFCCF